MKCLTATTIALACALLAPTVAHSGCRIYEHRDYGGTWYNLRDGERMIMVDSDVGCSTSHGPGCPIYYAEWNDDMSSFKVTQGCTITLWEDINEGGARWRTSKSYKYVGDEWNDEASEVLCTCS